MIRKILSTIACLTLMTSVTFSDELDKQKDQMLDSVVQLNYNGEACSGTVVISEETKPGYFNTVVLTAKHCVIRMDAHEYIMVSKNILDDYLAETSANVYYANLMVKHPDYDLAAVILRDHKTKFKIAKIASEEDIKKLKFGQEVWAVGYPMSGSLMITEGKLGPREYVSSETMEKIDGSSISVSGDFQKSTAQIAPGSSGGPLFIKNEKGDYVIIGVASMINSKANYLAYYVPFELVKSFVGKQDGSNTNK